MRYAKRISALLLTVLMVVSLASCGGGSPQKPKEDTGSSEAAAPSIVTPAGELPIVPPGTDITLTIVTCP